MKGAWIRNVAPPPPKRGTRIALLNPSTGRILSAVAISWTVDKVSARFVWVSSDAGRKSAIAWPQLRYLIERGFLRLED